MCGAVLGRLDRKLLMKAILRYIPVLILSMFATIGVACLVGPLLGYDLFNSLVVYSLKMHCLGKVWANAKESSNHAGLRRDGSHSALPFQCKQHHNFISTAREIDAFRLNLPFFVSRLKVEEVEGYF